MFLTLLLATFLIALGVAVAVARGFDRSVGAILARIMDDTIASAWQRYLRFALVVVGVSGGVRVYDLERYISPEARALAPGETPLPPLALTPERWTLEVYRTVIETLQSLAWALLLFFLVALVAYVLVRGREARAEASTARRPDSPDA